MICTACKRNPLIDNQTAALSVNIDDTLTLSWHTNGACCQPCADRLHALADQLGLVLDAFCSGLRDGDERPILRRVFERDDMREMLLNRLPKSIIAAFKKARAAYIGR